MIEVRRISGEVAFSAPSMPELFAIIQDRIVSATSNHSLYFSDMEISAIDLTGFKLRGCLFRRVVFQDVSLAMSSLHGSTFIDCRLKNVDLSDAKVGLTVFKDSRLERVNLQKTLLQEAVFQGSELVRCDLSDADMSGALFDFQLSLHGKHNRISNLTVLPSGVTWGEYLDQVLPYLLQSGRVPLVEVMKKEIWECHSWENCPMRVLFGVAYETDVPPQLRNLAREFINLYDGRLLTYGLAMKHVGHLID